MKVLYFCVFFVGSVLLGFSQGVQNKQLPITELPIRPIRTVSFTTKEGSYMNVDISPDGKTLVFDLLGDLYTVPVKGGKATQLTRGTSINLRPVWSPDGRRIAYISDITGSFHLNVADVDGHFHRVLGRDDEPLNELKMVSPLWFRGGHYIYIENSNKNNDRLAEVYGLTGGNLVTNPTSKRTLTFSNDGHLEYYIEGDTIFQFNHQTGSQKKWIVLPKNYISIALSPNGQWLVYTIETNMGKSLKIQNVQTNQERILVNEMSKKPYDYKALVTSQYISVSRDSRYIYTSYLGKIHQLNIATGEDEIIPFEADVKIDMGRLNYNTYRINLDSIEVKYIRSTNIRWDGKQLVFSALSKVFVMDLPSGIVRPLVSQQLNQFQPVYSPNGEWVAYVSWSDAEGGSLWKVPTKGGRPMKLSKSPGQYYGPVWSPDGDQLAVISGEPKLGSRNYYGTGRIQIITSNGQHIKTLNEEIDINNKLEFTSNNSELVYQPQFNMGRMLVARELETDSIKCLLSGMAGLALERSVIQSISISPDDRFIVFSASEDLYLIPRGSLNGNQIIYIPGKFPSAVRFANGIDPYWEEGGRRLCWTYGNKFFRIDPDRVIKAAEEKALVHDSLGITNTEMLTVTVEPDSIINIKLKEAQAFGHGIIALTNVRIITMDGSGVIENGSLLIHNGRIQAVGSVEQVTIPNGAHIIDLKGNTIIPGLVDLHLHMYLPSGVMAQQNWMLLSSLAFGVTTASDPSQVYGTFGYSELLKTGKMTGPRLFGAGEAVRPDFMIPMNNLEDARLLVRKRRTMGGILIKQYELNTRIQRQWLLMACLEGGVNMTNEGGVNPISHIGMIKDGCTGIEHNTPLGEVYNDIILLRAKCGTYWDPTLQVYVGDKFQARNYMNWKYWRSHIDEKMARFLPLDQLEQIKQASPADSLDPGFITPSKIDAEVRHEGGRVVLGSHGNDKGIGPHNELWALQAGGLTNMEALQAATILGAQALGIQQDVGSLEVGKIADLIILTKNPLDDIHNSREIRYVMKDGILYDGATLDEIWPETKKLPNWRCKGSIQ